MPVPAHIEMDFGLIRLGQVLGCPAAEVPRQPPHLVGAAVVWLTVEHKRAEAAEKRAQRRRKQRARETSAFGAGAP